MSEVLLVLAVACGALSQRVTGMGFALVAGPFLVLIAGAFQGVVLSNFLGLVVCIVVFAMSWRDVQWRRGLLLAVPALLIIPLGAWVARTLAPGPLTVLVGSLVVVALLAMRRRPEVPWAHGPGGTIAAGAASGFMNVTAGVGGPAMVLYAMATRWEQRSFAATFQFYGIFVNIASLATKGGLDVPPRAVALALGALAFGLVAGQLLAPRVSGERARDAVFWLALLGGLATIAKGVAALT